MAKKDNAKKAIKTFIVETPVKNFVGVGAAGVQFAYGKAEVQEGWVLEWFKKKGYKVTEKPEQPEAPEQPEDEKKKGVIAGDYVCDGIPSA